MAEGLTKTQGAALYFGAVLGTGVLVLPTLAEQVAGPASILAWALLIILSIPLAVTFAQLGSRYPGAGGVSSFASRAFGDLVGGIVGWIFYGGVMLGTPSAAMMGGIYLAQPFNGAQTVAAAAASGLYICAILVIALGVRTTARMQLAVTSLLAFTLIVVIATSVPYSDASNLHPFAPHGWLAVGQAASLLMFAFVGWEAVSPMSAEFRNPRQDLPWATAYALIATSVLYIGLAFVTTLALGDSNLGGQASLTALLSLELGKSASWVMAAIAALLTMGALLAYVGGGTKLGASLAGDGFLPSRFKHGTVAGSTPTYSLALVASIGMLVLAAMSRSPDALRFALHASSACFTAVYVIGSVAAVRLLRDSRKLSILAWLSTILSCIPFFFSAWFIAAPGALALVAILIRWSKQKYIACSGPSH